MLLNCRFLFINFEAWRAISIFIFRFFKGQEIFFKQLCFYSITVYSFLGTSIFVVFSPCFHFFVFPLLSGAVIQVFPQHHKFSFPLCNSTLLESIAYAKLRSKRKGLTRPEPIPGASFSEKKMDSCKAPWKPDRLGTWGNKSPVLSWKGWGWCFPNYGSLCDKSCYLYAIAHGCNHKAPVSAHISISLSHCPLSRGGGTHQLMNAEQED